MLLFSLCAFYNGEAQSLKGKFKVANQGGKQLNLYRTEGTYKYLIDSTKVKSDGTFSFSNKKRPLGYYKLSLNNENNIIEVIFNPKETKHTSFFSQPFLERGVQVIQSKENKAYWENKRKEIEVKKKRKKHYKSKEGKANLKETP